MKTGIYYYKQILYGPNPNGLTAMTLPKIDNTIHSHGIDCLVRLCTVSVTDLSQPDSAAKSPNVN